MHIKNFIMEKTLLKKAKNINLLYKPTVVQDLKVKKEKLLNK